MAQADSNKTTPAPVDPTIAQDNSLEGFASLYADIAAFWPTYEAAIQRRNTELTRRTGISLLLDPPNRRRNEKDVGCSDHH